MFTPEQYAQFFGANPSAFLQAFTQDPAYAKRKEATRSIQNALGSGLKSIIPTIANAGGNVANALTVKESGTYLPPNAAPLSALMQAAKTGNTVTQTVGVGPEALAKFQAEEEAKKKAAVEKRLQQFKIETQKIDEAQRRADGERFANTSDESVVGSSRRARRNREAQLRQIKVDGKDYATTLKEALGVGVDLRPYYGETYADAVKFKQDLGQYGGKDVGMIIPANPVGYQGQFKFDPNFGSAYYRDLAMESGKALGLSPEQVLKQGTEYFADKFASGNTKGVIGFTDFGKGLLDKFAITAGVPEARLEELRGTVLKPLYDANSKVFSGLNNAARIESNSSGFFKGIGQAISGLGPIGTIGLGLALGPAGLGLGAATAGAVAGGLGGLLQGDLSSAIKGATIGGIGGGALKGLDGLGSSVSSSVGGGALGNVLGNAATGAIKGGIGSLLSGGDLKQGLLTGAVGTAAGAGSQVLGDKLSSLLGGGALGQIGGGALQGGLASGLGAALTGRDFLAALKSGLVGGGVSSAFDAAGNAIRDARAKPPTSFDLDQGLSGGLDSVAGDLGYNYSEYIGNGLDGIAGDIGADFLGSTGRNVSLANFLATINGGVAPGRLNAQPYSTMNPLTGKEAVANPASGTGAPNVLKGLLGAGAAAALAKGLGGMSGSNNAGGAPAGGINTAQADPLQRELGFQFQAPTYESGLAGPTLQAPQYSVINPSMVPNFNYLRSFAEGGAINAGLGSIPGMAAGRMLEGPGDGMSDDINATIEGQEPVRLADGEYVIPAQVVSALGSGSSKAGSKVLDDMVKRVYTEQTGKPKQMKPINTKKVLPA